MNAPVIKTKVCARPTFVADPTRTKRARNAADDMSLEDHIAAHRHKLVLQRQEVGKLKQQANELRQQSKMFTHRWQVRMRSDLERRAHELEEEVIVRNNMKREHEFEKTVVSYLRFHKQIMQQAWTSLKDTKNNKDISVAYEKNTSTVARMRAAVLDAFLTDHNQAPPKVALSVQDVCPRCKDSQALLLCSVRSVLSCPSCGYSIAYLDATAATTSFDEIVEYSQYSYKRVNHFSLHLALVQGKESHQVPEEIILQVMQDLYDRQSLRSPDDVTIRSVHSALRNLKLRKAYDHVVQVTNRIRGKRLPQVSAETESKLKTLFLKMQPVFQRHAPDTRTNFLSYNYVLYRCFELMNLDHMLGNIMLLKGREKLEANDAIFQKIAETLGWKLRPLPPPCQTCL
tara:strand:- start:2572 stop:3771 length:1200 start_codon:yes stop_codon:yes gene_type:complete